MGVEGGGGYLQDAGSNKWKLMTIVDACINAGIYVIIGKSKGPPTKSAFLRLALYERSGLYGQSGGILQRDGAEIRQKPARFVRNLERTRRG